MFGSHIIIDEDIVLRNIQRNKNIQNLRRQKYNKSLLNNKIMCQACKFQLNMFTSLRIL